MKHLLICLAILASSPALAENPARSPPPEFYSERPVKGERIVNHNSGESLLSVCDRYGNEAMAGGNVTGCYIYSTRTIHVLSVGAWGTTAFERRCDLIHERGHLIAHMRGKVWNHEGERFCR